ncbi:hypothetical protein JNW88_31065, partial [Micromonospora sp. ATA32]|nr:hypothetical protein [Micromonospora sp. ATA32]
VPATDRLLAAVRHRRLLLVLDNCEHVIEPTAGLVARLLRDTPGVTVLATSREPLGLTGELVWEVPPLPVPEDDRDPDVVRRSAAARLFAPAPPPSSAASGWTTAPRRPSRSSAAAWTVCHWPWNWPRRGSARSASPAWWSASTTGSRCSPPSSGTCRPGSAPWPR